MKLIYTYLLFIFSLLVTHIYGVYVAFSVSGLMGIVTLLIPGAGTVVGLANIFGTNIPQELFNMLN